MITLLVVILCSTSNLAGIDVNVLGVPGIAFERTLKIAVVKLFDEVLLPEEISNLSA